MLLLTRIDILWDYILQDKLNASWQSERSILLSSKEEAEQKYAEIEEQVTSIVYHDYILYVYFVDDIVFC